MITLIGLGNPGSEYEFTRHNAGKLFVGYHLRQHPVEGVEAIETECYMNESGNYIKNQISAVKKMKQKEKDYRLLIIAHDDLDIPFGKFKIQFGKGPRQHKGILSIEGTLGTTEFWRVRIGIDARSKATSDKRLATSQNGEEYVLQQFSKKELGELEAVFSRIREQLGLLALS